MSEFNKALGVRLRRYRLRQGLTQQNIADNLKITFQQVQKYESGLNRISAEAVATLARILEINPLKLFSDDKPEAPNEEIDRANLNLYIQLSRCTSAQRFAITQIIRAFLKE